MKLYCDTFTCNKIFSGSSFHEHGNPLEPHGTSQRHENHVVYWRIVLLSQLRLQRVSTATRLFDPSQLQELLACMTWVRHMFFEDGHLSFRSFGLGRLSTQSWSPKPGVLLGLGARGPQQLLVVFAPPSPDFLGGALFVAPVVFLSYYPMQHAYVAKGFPASVIASMTGEVLNYLQTLGWLNWSCMAPSLGVFYKST